MGSTVNQGEKRVVCMRISRYPSTFAQEIERRGVVSRFFDLPQGELSHLELSLGCGSAFQHLPCSADNWVAVLLLYKGENTNASSPL
jgi:hypothetical protein